MSFLHRLAGLGCRHRVKSPWDDQCRAAVIHCCLFRYKVVLWHLTAWGELIRKPTYYPFNHAIAPKTLNNSRKFIQFNYWLHLYQSFLPKQLLKCFKMLTTLQGLQSRCFYYCHLWNLYFIQVHKLRGAVIHLRLYIKSLLHGISNACWHVIACTQSCLSFVHM